MSKPSDSSIIWGPPTFGIAENRQGRPFALKAVQTGLVSDELREEILQHTCSDSFCETTRGIKVLRGESNSSDPALPDYMYVERGIPRMDLTRDESGTLIVTATSFRAYATAYLLGPCDFPQNPCLEHHTMKEYLASKEVAGQSVPAASGKEKASAVIQMLLGFPGVEVVFANFEPGTFERITDSSGTPSEHPSDTESH